MLSLREARPSVGPHVPQPTTRTGLAFPARAPIPPPLPTPRERAPRVDGTAGEKHILGHLSSEFVSVPAAPRRTPGARAGSQGSRGCAHGPRLGGAARLGRGGGCRGDRRSSKAALAQSSP